MPSTCIQTTVNNIRQKLSRLYHNHLSMRYGTGVSFLAVMVPLVLCAAFALDAGEIAYVLAGIAAYLVLTMKSNPFQRLVGRSTNNSGGATNHRSRASGHGEPAAASQNATARHVCNALTASSALIHAGSHSHLSQASRTSQHQASSMAPLAPRFRSLGLDEEIDEMVAQLCPTTESNQAVQKLVHIAKQVVQPLSPDARVLSFVCGNPACNRAYGVAVPDVELVINEKPSVLLQQLHGKLTSANYMAVQRNPDKLQKAAIRMYTDELVAKAGFRFRRSSFSGQDPKVTLIAPSSVEILGLAIPVDLMVNSPAPLHCASLLSKCGELDPRIMKLILLVRRWARDRGISDAAKGFLTPYAWSLKAIYFLQVERPQAFPDLVRCDGWELLSCVCQEMEEPTTAVPLPCTPTRGAGETTASLFKAFVYFYHKEFNWHNEAVSVRRGQRGPPDPRMSAHVVLHKDKATHETVPSIEDPFDITRNVASSATSEGMARIHEELRRANDLCEQEASLVDLFDVWMPSERGCTAEVEEELESLTM